MEINKIATKPERKTSFVMKNNGSLTLVNPDKTLTPPSRRKATFFSRYPDGSMLRRVAAHPPVKKAPRIKKESKYFFLNCVYFAAHTVLTRIPIDDS
jgi:hypothetical protein